MAMRYNEIGLEIPIQLTEDTVLVCPKCGGGYLHQEWVNVFNRLREDDPSGLHVHVDGQEVTTDSDLSNNPSGRRDGMQIGFTCEECPRTLLTLNIYQQKGRTYIEWSPFFTLPKD